MGDVMLTRGAKARLFEEDQIWLGKQPRTLEREHLIDTVKWIATEIRAGLDPFEYWQQRAEQLQRDNEKLAAALRKSWNCYAAMYSTPYESQLKIFLDKHQLDREDFDRLIGGGT